MEASRHWLTCQKTKSREQLKEEGASKAKVILCGGNPPRRVAEEGGICKKVSRIVYTYYPRFLLHWITKLVTFFLFVGYVVCCVWGASRIKSAGKMEELLPHDSYLTTYLSWDRQYFPSQGPWIMFVAEYPPVVGYHNVSLQRYVSAMLRTAESFPAIVNDSRLSWLEDYMTYRKRHNLATVAASEAEFIRELLDGFLVDHPIYRQDVILNEDQTAIVASRFYVLCGSGMADSDMQAEMMSQMRRTASRFRSSVTFVAYSSSFVFYEHYVSVLKNTMLPVGVTMIGLLFVALVFIPHPIAVTCVSVAMISIVIGMMGLMHFWNMALGPVTVIQIIMSLGIGVSFTVHMSHSFMTATGKNRNERVTVAIEKVGIPILNGALSTIFCAVMLSFGSSFIFESFFKSLVLVFFLGLSHSLVFLPVLFSLIGPRRTSKPRVFVAVSPSSRSLQDTYRANAIVSGSMERKSSSQDLDRTYRSSAEPLPDCSVIQEEEEDVAPETGNSQPGAVGRNRTDVEINITSDTEQSSDPERTRNATFALGAPASLTSLPAVCESVPENTTRDQSSSPDVKPTLRFAVNRNKTPPASSSPPRSQVQNPESESRDSSPNPDTVPQLPVRRAPMSLLPKAERLAPKASFDHEDDMLCETTDSETPDSLPPKPAKK